MEMMDIISMKLALSYLQHELMNISKEVHKSKIGKKAVTQMSIVCVIHNLRNFFQDVSKAFCQAQLNPAQLRWSLLSSSDHPPGESKQIYCNAYLLYYTVDNQ